MQTPRCRPFHVCLPPGLSARAMPTIQAFVVNVVHPGTFRTVSSRKARLERFGMQASSRCLHMHMRTCGTFLAEIALLEFASCRSNELPDNPSICVLCSLQCPQPLPQ